MTSTIRHQPNFKHHNIIKRICICTMKLALLATLASAATAFVAPSTPITARLPTQIFAEEESSDEDAAAPYRSAQEISALTSCSV